MGLGIKVFWVLKFFCLVWILVVVRIWVFCRCFRVFFLNCWYVLGVEFFWFWVFGFEGSSLYVFFICVFEKVFLLEYRLGVRSFMCF